MDPFIEQIRAAYRQNPQFVVAFLVMSAVVGIYFGYRILGPAIGG
jgi:hypothetical protein